MSTQADCFECVFVPNRCSSQAMAICLCTEVLFFQTTPTFSKVLFCIADHILKVSRQNSLLLSLSQLLSLKQDFFQLYSCSQISDPDETRESLEAIPKTYYFEVSNFRLYSRSE
ncbi:unnamed protein product [Moneuplotes crassus]|uniref:Uncharacterized protein n=1 Tax=Euplotes crassus TaxID=5936 RepID=A0AAD1XD56_EUPCR|nr:unnamed protein product [Moneuplotes crassus]